MPKAPSPWIKNLPKREMYVLFDPKLDETYVENIIKTYVASNIILCFRFDPTLKGAVLTDVILAGGRLLDAFGMANERRKSVQKAKAPTKNLA